MSVTIRVGDALSTLRTLESDSVQLVCTSPPYFNLRDYGTATWDGGDPVCDHQRPPMGGVKASTLNAKRDENGWLAADGHAHPNRQQFRDICGKCGARRVDGQIGLEPTPQAFLEALWAVFDEVKRVLHPSGLVFCNIGDSYAGSGKGGQTGTSSILQKPLERQGFVDAHTYTGIPAKNLLLIPQRFAIGMQDRGWICRSAIVWAKTSAMPESVRDRPTSAWEPIWMFAKSARYFYDGDAVRQPYAPDSTDRYRYVMQGTGPGSKQPGGDFDRKKRELGIKEPNPTGANLRNVWLLGPEPSAEAHYASFPTAIPKRCILAGTSEKGACPACGSPWVRVVERVLAESGRKPGASEYSRRDPRFARGGAFTGASADTLGWQPGCSCDAGAPRPCVVLDPFAGSGTTLLVADRLGRDAIGIELNSQYAEMARQRIDRDAGSLWAEPVVVEDARQADLFTEVAAS